MNHIDRMTEAEMAFYFDIPPAFDRRGETVVRPKVETKRKWVMPSPERIKRMKKKQAEIAKKIARANALDSRIAAPEEVVDTLTQITKVNK